ncbi:SAM-dependent methyltransferase [Nocardioides daeguensis]|uniref:Class I SAM-dependent methyltransferase n=1 Tax=Nocardioides daeguensis TaxID=908359 RepID=A0ABP6VPR4_9ACTN|nr:cyclopropane-fatty-acyl-phospholipid synthase family protein [Nocardioides daeguensis]MBV6727450.1 cyclopropane-fatty-acyl-phospholipid synthase family protein [Nocardioides daeguensis]MCR1773328.1 cyclopropane-fatty-acyl-phospholipid synthase family protein [Nocardioides daeguensis]
MTTAHSGKGIAPTITSLFAGGLPVWFKAYDGSSAGDLDLPYGIELVNERGLAYLMSAPGDLGLARAYVAGDLVLHGAHPGDPYPAFSLLKDHTDFGIPGPRELVGVLRSLGLSHLVPPPPPPQEHLPAWRTRLEGLRSLSWWGRHSHERDADAIRHHYDVSNTFYEHVLGPSMTYTCAVFPTPDATLEEAQEHKYDLVCRKLGLQPGQRLLDIGCGWGGMVRHAAQHYGVQVLGVTLSREQATWAQEEIKRQGLDDLAEVRHSDYRLVEEGDFDAVSSIGLTEHIGIANYPAYFSFIHDKLKPQGRLLNHCITRHDNVDRRTGAFIDRYVFPDGELAGSGTIVEAVENAGLEVQHHENLRVHYAKTLAGWCQNLADNWDACVAETDEGTARVWGLYMAGSRIAFERNEIQLHHVLATRTDDGVSGYPLRHDF